MSAVRDFPTRVVLTLMHGRLLCDFADLHALCDHLAGESLLTHQLPRVCKEAEPMLRGLFPDLAALLVPEFSPGRAAEEVPAWCEQVDAHFGATRSVPALGAEEHTSIHPLAELRMMRPDLPVIVVDGDL